MRIVSSFVLTLIIFTTLIGGFFYLFKSFKKDIGVKKEIAISVISIKKEPQKEKAKQVAKSLKKDISKSIQKNKKLKKTYKPKVIKKIVKKPIKKPKKAQILKKIGKSKEKKRVKDKKIKSTKKVAKKSIKIAKHKGKTKRKKVAKKQTFAKQTIAKNQISSSQFLANIKARVASNQYYPPMAKRRSLSGRVFLSFTVLANGAVSRVSASGDRAFLKAAKEALYNSFPIPTSALPQGLPKRYDIVLTYRLR